MNDYSLLLESMRASIVKMSQEVEKYSLIFKREDFFSFSDAQKRKKLYKAEYNKIICKINELYVPFEQCTVKTSSLLLESDRATDEETFNYLSEVFSKCLMIEKELYIFTSKNEQELEKNISSVSALSEYASRFLLILKTFIEFLMQA